jgi:peroxiredoxin
MSILTKSTLIAVITSLCFISFAAGAKQTKPSKSRKYYKHGFAVKIGDVAPDFTIKYMDKKKKDVKLSSLRGNVVLLQFTSYGCGVCRREMPFLEKEVYQKFKNEKFKIIAIHRWGNATKAKTFIKQTGITYPMVLDLNAKIFNLYSKPRSGIARNVLIDKNGKVIFITRLFKRKEFDQLIEKIDSLLNSCSLDGGC